eukprot:359282-Pleurochrysis_carterae.AAC.3
MPGVASREVYFCVAAPKAHCGKVSREHWWDVRRVAIAGIIHNDACAASMKMGDLGCPRSAGCSSIYSEPASRAAVRMAAVRRTSSFASASSRLCCGATSGRPRGCSRLLRTGGPPSGEELERKCREIENVEQGGDAMTTAYSPAAQRWRSRWYTESLSAVVVDGVAVPPELREERGNAVRSMKWTGEEEQDATRPGSGTKYVICCAYVVGRRQTVGVGQPMLFRRRGGLRWHTDSADASGGRRGPREAGLVEVDVGSDNGAEARDKHVKCSGRARVPPEIDSNPCAGVHARLQHGRLWFDGEGFASEWHDAHDRRLLSRN